MNQVCLVPSALVLWPQGVCQRTGMSGGFFSAEMVGRTVRASVSIRLNTHPKPPSPNCEPLPRGHKHHVAHGIQISSLEEDVLQHGTQSRN